MQIGQSAVIAAGMNESLVILTPQFGKLKRHSGVSSNCPRKLEQKALGGSKRFIAEPSM